MKEFLRHLSEYRIWYYWTDIRYCMKKMNVEWTDFCLVIFL
jgi:hypothetical protein